MIQPVTSQSVISLYYLSQTVYMLKIKNELLYCEKLCVSLKQQLSLNLIIRPPDYDKLFFSFSFFLLSAATHSLSHDPHQWKEGVTLSYTFISLISLSTLCKYSLFLLLLIHLKRQWWIGCECVYVLVSLLCILYSNNHGKRRRVLLQAPHPSLKVSY